MTPSAAKLRAAADVCEERYMMPAWLALTLSGCDKSSDEWKLMNRYFGLSWEPTIAPFAQAHLRHAAHAAERIMEAQR
jgi:hypothetical protein